MQILSAFSCCNSEIEHQHIPGSHPDHVVTAMIQIFEIASVPGTPVNLKHRPSGGSWMAPSLHRWRGVRLISWQDRLANVPS
jgi:hypothetical protein